MVDIFIIAGHQHRAVRCLAHADVTWIQLSSQFDPFAIFLRVDGSVADAAIHHSGFHPTICSVLIMCRLALRDGQNQLVRSDWDCLGGRSQVLLARLDEQRIFRLYHIAAILIVRFLHP